jgi:carboxyl-terminal processing protease
MNRMSNQRTGRQGFLLATLAATWLTTASLAATAQDPDSTAADPVGDGETASLSELRSFADALSLIRGNYVDPVAESILLEAATRGLVDALDDYSDYLGPDAFRDQDENNRGRQVGIGVRVGIEDKRLIVQDVYPDGPAFMAGVQRGDIIQAIDGERVRGRRLQASLNALAGEAGSPVGLRLKTPGMAARELTLERAYVPVPSVQAERLPGDIALLRVDRFTLDTSEEFKQALSAMQPPSGDELAGIIIDLRNNWGGVIRPAAEIADGFLDGGKVVYTRGRYQDSRLEYDALPGQWTPNLPVAVLVNGGSASASEILAGALQDHGRATVVGSRTFGKGTVQSIFRLRNGSAIKLTTARYFMPSGRSFDGQGIEPDIAVEDQANAAGEFVAPGEDPVLQAALDAFRTGAVAGG